MPEIKSGQKCIASAVATANIHIYRKTYIWYRETEFHGDTTKLTFEL